MGQHPGEDASQDHGLVPRVGIDAVLGLLLDPVIETVDLSEAVLRLRIILIEGAVAAAHHLVELHGLAVGAHSGHHHVDVAPGEDAVAVAAVADAQELLHGIAHDHHGPADQIRILPGNVVVQGLGELDVGPLLHVGKVVGRDDPVRGHGLVGPLALAGMLRQEGRVLAGRLQHVLHGLVGILRRGGEAVDAVFVDPGGHAELLRPHVAHQGPIQEHRPPVHVPLGPELRVGARGKQILFVRQEILYHLHAPLFGLTAVAGCVLFSVPYFSRLWNHPAVEFTKNPPQPGESRSFRPCR